MSIGHIPKKIKETLSRCEKRDIYTPFVIVLVGVCSFFLGKIGATEAAKSPVVIEMVDMPKAPPKEPVVETKEAVPKTTAEAKTKGKYVASKNGKKYYPISCSSAKSITLANRVYFETKEAAEKAGLTPAGNCKGI